jgi:hypothetical protein
MIKYLEDSLSLIISTTIDKLLKFNQNFNNGRTKIKAALISLFNLFLNKTVFKFY